MPGVVWATDRRLRVSLAQGRLRHRFVGHTIPEAVAGSPAARRVISAHRSALSGERQRFEMQLRKRWFRAVPDRHCGGLGIGLFIVKNILKAFGGSIAVESGKGRTRFSARFPMRRQE
jgi:hypothetical protein